MKLYVYPKPEPKAELLELKDGDRLTVNCGTYGVEYLYRGDITGNPFLSDALLCVDAATYCWAVFGRERIVTVNGRKVIR